MRIDAGAPPKGGLFARLGAAFAAFRRRRARRATMAALEALSDRTLSDIGISRDALRRMSVGGFDAAALGRPNQ